MGADLCGHIFVMPRKLTEAAAKRALARMNMLAASAKELRDILDLGEGVNAERDDFQLVHEYGEVFGMDLEDAADDLASLDPAAELANIRAFWKGEYRDQMWRRAPDNPRRRMIMAAGQQTWGDGPTEGSAWHVARRIVALGLQSALNIE